MIHTYAITGMHCAACVKRLTAALQPFAREVRVTLEPPQAVLVDPLSTATMDKLKAAVAAAGSYELVPIETKTTTLTVSPERSWLQTYWPLLLILAYIGIVSLAGILTFADWMLNAMAGFFLVFSAFKFLDLRGFADAYASYDLLAKGWPTYGFIYPFVELALGLAYLFRFNLTATHIATIIVMGFSSLGVINALRNKQRIQCACLGTVLNLPMSTITLVEDLAMVAMAAVMLIAAH